MIKRQNGFTLIELIMVIVILGILAAFALPRFADLSGEARYASINGALGAVRSASAIVHSTAVAKNQTGPSGRIKMEGQSIQLAYGYAVHTSIIFAAQLSREFEMLNPIGTFRLGSCFFTYTDATATAPAKVSEISGASGESCAAE